MSNVHLFINTYSTQQKFRIAIQAGGRFKDLVLMEGAKMGRRTTAMDNRDDTFYVVGVPSGVRRQMIERIYRHIVTQRQDQITTEDIFNFMVEDSLSGTNSSTFSVNHGWSVDHDTRAAQVLLQKLDPMIQAFAEFRTVMRQYTLSSLPHEPVSFSVSIHDDVMFLGIERSRTPAPIGV